MPSSARLQAAVDTRERYQSPAPTVARDPWGRVMVTQPPPDRHCLPSTLRAALSAGTAEGVSQHLGRDGRPLIAWVRPTALGTLVETYQPLPEDLDFYSTQTAGDAEAAALLAKTAREANEDLRHLVVDLGLSPSFARSQLLQINQAILRTLLEAAATVYAAPAVLPQLRLAAPRAGAGVRLPPTNTLRGTAQFARSAPWRPNPNGIRRTVAEVAGVLKEAGVELSDAMTIRMVKDDFPGVPANAHAAYSVRYRGERVTLEGMLDPRTQTVEVFVKESVFDSDEALVAVLSHEQHEIDSLVELLAAEGSLSIDRVRDLLRPLNPGNLHDAAWDIADRVVEQMRRRK